MEFKLFECHEQFMNATLFDKNQSHLRKLDR